MKVPVEDLIWAGAVLGLPVLGGLLYLALIAWNAWRQRAELRALRRIADERGREMLRG